MHIKLPQKIEEKLYYWRRKLLPRTLFFRTMMLIFVPLIVVQVVSVVVFFDGSWSRMGKKLSENLVDDFSMIIALKEDGVSDEKIREMAEKNLQMNVNFAESVNEKDLQKESALESVTLVYFKECLESRFKDFERKVYYVNGGNDLNVEIKKDNQFYSFVFSKKKVFSSSIFMFVVWMVATSVLLFLVSVLFLRIQVRAIADLAQTAENFGKGIDDGEFKPYGSSEVRTAGLAFIKMKERIVKQMVERTQMLAGISHDLRTPLTRLKLMVTMMPEYQDKQDFLADIDEMEKMLNGYLSFVRGEGDEAVARFSLNALIKDIVKRMKHKNVKIKYFADKKDVEVVAKEQALRRAVTNIINNACRYGKKVEIKTRKENTKIFIEVEDDGPGIPEDKRVEVFKAFYRLENSRNKETGGIGLGLAITKDIVISHGGKIMLDKSKMGGLKVVIELPL